MSRRRRAPRPADIEAPAPSAEGVPSPNISDAPEIGFFLSRLQPETRVLDCGCGQGSITIQLARVVAPARVVGIDVSPIAIQRASAQASARDVPNVQFETASVYNLPYDKQSFDAVLGHAILDVLAEPAKALAQMRRVLKQGGLLGLRAADWRGRIWAPSDGAAAKLSDLFCSLIVANGGDPDTGRKLRGLVEQAGFRRYEIGVTTT